MCTTCDNHLHKEYNVDYIENEQTIDITTENVPCQHEQNIYIVQDDADDECNCNKHKCEEPKKVSCRSLACRQLNDECSCKCKKKIHKTTMVNVLENNVMRLEDKMNDGCASMHENIEDLENNINTVYNELKDEEARAKQQEAFLHYGLDDAVTRAWYNPEDRKIHFYHKNPSNCLNVNVHEGCDCDCCNACGCECKCNNDECQSDIPYTMDDDCNIIPMSRIEEELPFFIDCTDFLRDIFISNAYLEDGLVDPEGDVTHQFLVIEFTRYFEPGLPVDDDQSVTPQTIRIDLTEIWKLDNYYDKWKIDELIQAIYNYIDQKVSELNAKINAVDNRVTLVDNRVTLEVNTLNTTIDNTKTEINQNIDNTKSEINLNINNTKNELIDIINNIDTSVAVIDNNPTLGFGKTWEVGTINGDRLRVTMPADPTLGANAVTIDNVTLEYGKSKNYGTINGQSVSITMPAAINPDDFATRVSNLDPTLGTQSIDIAVINGTDKISAKIPNVVLSISKSGDNLVIHPLDGNSYNIQLPTQQEPGVDFDHYVTGGHANQSNWSIYIEQNGDLADVPIQLPGAIINVQPNGTNDGITVTPSTGEPWNIPFPPHGEGADGNDYVVSGEVNNNVLTLTRKEGGTIDINLPQQETPRYITNITQDGNTVTFTWSDDTTTNINVGGQPLWEHIGNNIIRPVDSGRQVHGAGFYDTTVS